LSGVSTMSLVPARSRRRIDGLHNIAGTGHLNRGFDGIFELVRVMDCRLVSIAEVHAIRARAHLAQSEPEAYGSRLVQHHSKEVLCHRCRNEFPDELTNAHISKLCFPS
jgi:hypothetical protein